VTKEQFGQSCKRRSGRPSTWLSIGSMRAPHLGQPSLSDESSRLDARLQLLRGVDIKDSPSAQTFHGRPLQAGNYSLPPAATRAIPPTNRFFHFPLDLRDLASGWLRVLAFTPRSFIPLVSTFMAVRNVGAQNQGAQV
jgi:hypothetical protein